MKKSEKSRRIRWPKDWRRSLWIIPGLGLLVKLIIITQIPGNAWLGADGENYLKGLEFLVRDGFLSQESILHYWPAGYPLLMWVVSTLDPQTAPWIMAVLQSVLYAFSTAYFSQKVNDTALRRFALTLAIVLTISPTLALNTIAVGYELISASVFLLSLALFIGLSQSSSRKFWSWQVIVIGTLFSLNNFVQPRFLLSSLIFFILLGIFLYRKRVVPFVVMMGMLLSFALPSIMIFRNATANDFATISTNLGVTMRIGAGEGATGAYVPSFSGVECPEVKGNSAEVDQALVQCTIGWYLDNPTEIVRLAFNKSIYFWSPWFGPLANGSMARNPWLQVNPIYDIATGSQEGYDLVFGTLGKGISWVWMIAYLGAILLGFRRLLSVGDLGKHLAVLVGSLIVANWMISLGTLGDHRQRLPILTVVIFLQVIGLMSLKKTKAKKGQGKSKK